MVWLAKNQSLSTDRIIKGILKSSVYHEKLIEEAHLMKNLKHPGIPVVFDLEEDEEYTYIIEEYIEGASLETLCKKGFLSEESFFEILIRIISIINYLHSLENPIIYRDIKPDNILVAQNEGKFQVYLVDFGASAFLSETKGGASFGTKGYGAPEQRCNGRIDERTDIYSLGRLIDYLIEHSAIDSVKKKKMHKLALLCSREKACDRLNSVALLIKLVEKVRDSNVGKRGLRKWGKLKHHEEKAKTVSIGVIGLGPREGSTYITLIIVNTLKEIYGKTVYCVDYSSHHDIEEMLIRTGVNVKDKIKRTDDGIVYDSIHYLHRDYNDFVKETPEYTCVVHDLGCDRAKAAAVLKQCEIKLAVTSAVPWREEELRSFERERQHYGDEKEWTVIFSPAEEELIKNFSGCGMRMFPFPFEVSYKKPSVSAVKIIRRVLTRTC